MNFKCMMVISELLHKEECDKFYVPDKIIRTLGSTDIRTRGGPLYRYCTDKICSFSESNTETPVYMETQSLNLWLRIDQFLT